MPETMSAVRIYYEDLGQGDPALLMLPAWCMSHAGFATLPQTCAANRRVLALDWRGHGQSASPSEDFGAEGLVEDALAVIAASGAKTVIPVTLSHAGWVGIELRQRLGDRIPKLIHLDWLVLPPPPEYVAFVSGLTEADKWESVRATLFDIWLEGIDDPTLTEFVRGEMGAYGADMWMRSGRGIGGCYQAGGYPLNAMMTIDPPVPILHLYAQPATEDYLAAQKAFAHAHPWYHVHRLQAKSHFPTFEVPEEMARVIEDFVES
ncbi:alpha/beta hydrolase [Trichothermofontia sichuanensis B231]|uniref:alpha/beta fold hydrolase n=1 Tax=Trichothermofontia sichuanensis TaxID=3045816 RepID=UPI0022461C1D|nr:alpha/beta hydrolase [Trichothermofontia sichuanensis]UZQ53052.1 alpha/beta hydrolase [Trichothermofontia sichuanensis B231]